MWDELKAVGEMSFRFIEKIDPVRRINYGDFSRRFFGFFARGLDLLCDRLFVRVCSFTLERQEEQPFASSSHSFFSPSLFSLCGV